MNSKIIILVMFSECVRAVCICKAPVVRHSLQIQEKHTDSFLSSFT